MFLDSAIDDGAVAGVDATFEIDVVGADSAAKKRRAIEEVLLKKARDRDKDVCGTFVDRCAISAMLCLPKHIATSRFSLFHLVDGSGADVT